MTLLEQLQIIDSGVEIMKHYALYNYDTKAWETKNIYTTHEEAVEAMGQLKNIVILVLEF